MQFVQLTHAQRRAFEADGFLIVPQVIDAATVAYLTAASDRLLQSFLDDPAEIQMQLRQGVVQEEAFDQLVSNSATIPLVVQLLSPNIHLHSASLIYKNPKIHIPQHQCAVGIAILALPEIWDKPAYRVSA